MELAKKYYEEIILTIFKTQKEGKEIFNHCAFGLVGYGSECFGFDDELSKDHDFSPAICIWMTKDDLIKYSNQIRILESKFPETFMGFKVKNESEFGKDRREFLSIEDFYFNFLGLEKAPETIKEWQNIPEYFLATATNGEVFLDNLGIFSDIRSKVKKYPNAMRLNKIATRLMKISQSGQYNYPRTLKRNDLVTAHIILSEFMNEVMHFVYLLNNKYQPFYKWSFKGLNQLEILGKDIYLILNDMIFAQNKIPYINKICKLIKEAILKEKLSTIDSDFLGDYGLDIQKNIDDDFFKNYSAWMD